MQTNLTKEEIEVLERIVSVLLDWSGVTDDTPDDTEIIASNTEYVSLGDLRDASVTVDKLKLGAK